MKTGIGIIGCGQISRFHHEGWDRAGARIVHVCDMRSEVATEVAARYSARVSTDYKTLLADPEVELISVCTTAGSHLEICLAALAAGKGVVCEKTLSNNPNDAATIARAAAQSGLFFATAYMKRFFPATLQAKSLLSEMGEVISIHARSWQAWDLWNGEIPASFSERPSAILKNYGGGILACGGSHVIDLLHWLAGRPTRVAARMHIPENMDIDIQTSALLWMEQGGVAHLDFCWHPLSFAGYERNGWDEKVEINTTKGRLTIYTVLWNQPTNNGALLVHEDLSGVVKEFRFPPVNPFDLEMAGMLRLFQANEKASPSAWDGYVVDEIIAQITASAAWNQVLPITWQDRRP